MRETVELTEREQYGLAHVRACETAGQSILPNGVAVAFAGEVNAKALSVVLKTAAILP